jgi:subtilase family serine protease
MRYRYARRVRRGGFVVIGIALGLVLGLSVLSNSVFPAGSQAAQGFDHRSVCLRPDKVATAYCHAHVLTHAGSGKIFATVSYSSGLNPQQLRDAYKLPGASGSFAWNGQTIAIVDAYDNPHAAGDLLAYRQQFDLPLCADASVDCLFNKVNQNGASSPLPAGNTGWGQEIDLDIEMASTVCPDCKVLLVEASSNYFSDLGVAEDRAVAMGANAISNSYGGSEFSSETSSIYNGHFNHPGVAITVSSGDSGYGVEFPAASQYVTAVGGTSLKRDSTAGRGWTETAWSGAGSGCSAYIGRPSWQPAIGTCTHRMVADVSAIADPYTGVAVYDSYGSSGGANWYIFGGTSVASPIIAGVYALAGNAGGSSPSIHYGEYPYSHTASLFDVTSGSNGRCTWGRNSANLALCNAVSSYDGPTGFGTPNGTNAF